MVAVEGHASDHGGFLAHEKRPRVPADVCVPGEDGSPEHSVDCLPAPPAAPPAVVAATPLGRSDAIEHTAPVRIPTAVKARAPAPDLLGLSVSRT
ncbi:hypothetical protein GCM10028789_06090 [Sinomonas halotolerans]